MNKSKKKVIKLLHLAHDHEKGKETNFAMMIRWKDNFGLRFQNYWLLNN
jgi:hypothetical protein